MTANNDTVDNVGMHGALPCVTTPDRPGEAGRQQESQPSPATGPHISNPAYTTTGWLLLACGAALVAVLAINWSTPSPAPAAAAQSPVECAATPVEPIRVSSFPRVRPAGGGAVPLSVYVKAVDRIWWQESRRGQDPRAARGIVGEHGELGEMQVTPQWREDAERLTGLTVDPYNLDRLRYQALVYLMHYAPGAGATTVDDLCAMYRMGPTGFRRAAEQETP